MWSPGDRSIPSSLSAQINLYDVRLTFIYFCIITRAQSVGEIRLHNSRRGSFAHIGQSPPPVLCVASEVAMAEAPSHFAGADNISYANHVRCICVLEGGNSGRVSGFFWQLKFKLYLVRRVHAKHSLGRRISGRFGLGKASESRTLARFSLLVVSSLPPFRLIDRSLLLRKRAREYNCWNCASSQLILLDQRFTRSSAAARDMFAQVLDAALSAEKKAARCGAVQTKSAGGKSVGKQSHSQLLLLLTPIAANPSCRMSKR